MKKKQLIKVEIEDVNRAIEIAYPGKRYIPVIKGVTILNGVQYFDVINFLMYPSTVLPDDVYDYIASVYEREFKKSKRNAQRRVN
ncbi:hypothetical protein LG275_03995 [Chryseomicrobium palamuruense]